MKKTVSSVLKIAVISILTISPGGCVAISKKSKNFTDQFTENKRVKTMYNKLTTNMMVEDVKELYTKLRDKVKIIKGIQTTFYGKQEFYIRDCNGYILTFAGNV